MLKPQDTCSDTKIWSRIYFQQALEVFERDSFHQAEVARTKFKMIKFHIELLDDDEGAHNLLRKATSIFRLVTDDSKKRSPTYQSQDVDFDQIVLYWSR